MNPAKADLYPEETLDLEVVMDPANSGYIPDTTTWASNDSKIATVDQHGRVTAVAPGRVEITATMQRTNMPAYTATMVLTVLTAVDDVEIDQKAANPQGITGRYVGEMVQLTATVTPVNASNKNIIWTSADPKVCTVSPEGIVTFTGMGRTKVRAASAQNPEIYDEIVMIGGRDMVELHVDPEYVSLYPGEYQDINATFTPSAAFGVTPKYTSADDSIAKVDRYGRITAVAPGSTMITAQIYDDPSELTTKTIHVTVKRDVDKVYFDPDFLKLYQDQEADLTKLLFFNDGTNGTMPEDTTVRWESLDKSIVTVDKYGKLFAKNVGDTIVYAYATNNLTGKELRAELHVKVIRQPFEIQLSAEKISTMVGEQTPISYTFVPNYTTETKVTWTSSNPSVAYYDEVHGKIVALKSGSTHITVTAVDGGPLDFEGNQKNPTATDTVYVEVIQPATSVKFTDTTTYCKYEGQMFKVRATAQPANTYDPTIVWSVSNPNVAVIDEFGVVTCVAPGKTYIFATAHNGVSAIAHLTVDAVPASYDAVCLYNNVFIRDKATLQGVQLGQFYKGDTMIVTGIEGEWYKINYNGRTAYVHTAYIQLTGKNEDGVVVGKNPSNGKVANTTTATVYTNPGSGYETTAPKGTRVLILAESGNYYKISYGTNMLSTGYIAKKYVQPDNGFKYGVATQTTDVIAINPNGYESTTPQVTTVTKAVVSRQTDAREGAGKNFKEVASLTKGTAVMLNSQLVNGYYQVIFTNGTIAWVEAAALSNFHTVQRTEDKLYDNSEGFESITKTYATVNADVLNVREGAGTNYKVIGTVRNGEKVTVVNQNNGWLYILMSNGRTGYVSAQYATVTKVTEEIKFTSGIVENANVEKFVIRCYDVILNRTPDSEGLAGWVDGIKDGSMSPSQVVWGIVNSREFANKNYSDAEFLTVLYASYFDRQPDAAGYQHWMNQLKNGVPRTEIIKGFDNSEEFNRVLSTFGLSDQFQSTAGGVSTTSIKSFVTRCYTTILGRQSEAEGLKYWTNELASGKITATNVVWGFVQSPEYLNKNTSNAEFVTTLYAAYFDRQPDPVGYQDWMNRLSSGTSRQNVIEGFSNSQEFQKLLASYGLND